MLVITRGYQLCPENRRCFGQGQFPYIPYISCSKSSESCNNGPSWRSVTNSTGNDVHSEHFWTIFLFVWAWHLRPKPRIAFPPTTDYIPKNTSNIIWPIWQPSPQFWLVFWRHPLLFFTWPWPLNNLVLGELMWNSILFRVCLKIGYPKLHLYHDVLHSNCHWAWLEHKSRKP